MATSAARLLTVLSVVMAVEILPARAHEVQPAIASTNASARASSTPDPIARIRDEGLNRSQVMDTLGFLCDVIGPRLTGSPNMRHANEWTRDKLASWGLTNADLEPWGSFGRGWSLDRFSMQIVEPQAFPLIAAPKAWSPGLEKPTVAKVVLLDAKTAPELEKFAGRLTGAVVLVSSPREVKARFEPPATRLSESNLLRLANAPAGTRSTRQSPASPAILSNTPAPAMLGLRSNAFQTATATNPPPTNQARTASARTNAPARQISTLERLQFALREGVALCVSSSSRGDGGTLFVESATALASGTGSTNAPAASRRSSPAWSTNAGPIPPQVTMAAEDYNRLVRLANHGNELKAAVEFAAQFHTNDLAGYNTVAEIPGSDLKDEIVMLGAHLDSWHAGTGATDNGAGVAVVMEAVRIIQALKLQPRRTIRVALWSGEEQGLLGSSAYVRKHFGYYTNITNITDVALALPPKGASEFARLAATSSSSTAEPTPRVTRKLVRQRDYENLSAYFNLDNGTGRIRGVYMQGNEAVRPLFRQWLEPFRDLGAETLTAGNTGGTDHIPFDAVGLPGFQFIQDPIEYWTRTHHSNADVLERIQADDLKQASVIMAAFVYNAATSDEKVPRKPVKE